MKALVTSAGHRYGSPAPAFVPMVNTPCQADPAGWDMDLDNNGRYAHGETDQARTYRIRSAIEACIGCPVLAACAAADTTGTAGVIAGRVVGYGGSALRGRKS